MIPEDSQVLCESSRSGLWSEYAHQLISIHACCALAWWSLALAHQPSYPGLALVCWLTSGWILLRQCSLFTHRSAWFTSVSIILVCALAWQATGPQLRLAIPKEEAIFSWWTLSAILLASELILRREHPDAARPRQNQTGKQSISMDLNRPAASEEPGQLPLAQLPLVSGGSDGSGELQESASPSADANPNTRRGLKWALLLILSLVVVYMVVVPSIEYAVERMTPPKSGRVLEDMTLAEKMRLHSVTGVVMLTFLALGGTIGSFLNVVIYRVPRGQPLLWPPSSCASCGTRIQGKDNIPVLGWILLSGRCRTCSAPISARYPIIEAIVAAIFITLYYVELLSGGDNVPVRMPNSYRGVVWILLYTKWDLLGLYLYHCVMLSLLLVVAMINVDGFRLPRRAAIFLVVAFGTLSIGIPALRPVSAAYVPAFATCFVGLIVGSCIGGVFQLLLPVERKVELKVAGDSTLVTDIRNEAVVVARILVDAQNAENAEVAMATDSAITTSTVLPVASDRSSKYGQPAVAPTRVSDAGFAMAFLGLTLGPQAALTVALLLLPVLVAYLLPLFGWLQSRPITLFIFAMACGHQLFWVQLHRLMGFAG